VLGGPFEYREATVTLAWRVRMLRALFVDAWPLWLGVGGFLGAALAAVLLRSGGEAQVRTAGMLLQVIGLATVAVGLSKTRRLFKRPSVAARVGMWFGRLWSVFAPSKSTTVHLQGVAATAAAGTARVRVGAAPDAPLDRRVAVLEQNYELLQRQVDQQEAETNQRLRALRSEVQAESSARQAEDRLTTGKLEELAVGGLHLEGVGVGWLWLGVIGTSVPAEIAAWLGRVF